MFSLPMEVEGRNPKPRLEDRYALALSRQGAIIIRGIMLTIFIAAIGKTTSLTLRFEFID